MCRVLLLSLCLGGCVVETAAEHGEDPHDALGDPHDPQPARDLATEPCYEGNWQGLFPDLRECILWGARLEGASLRRADLTDADLSRAHLAGADLFKAVLRGASFAEADLDGAKLTGGDLTNTNLTGASLSGATLTNAIFTGATLEGAATDETTTCPTGSRGPCW